MMSDAQPRRRGHGLLRATIVGALALALILAGGPAALANPVVTPTAADPAVVRAPDGSFYMYTTADDWADGQGTRQMPIFQSFDLVDWRYAGDVFAQRPAWQQAGSGLWAPDIHYVDGRYLLYYSVGGVANPCIGLATAPTPTGPWLDLGRPVLCAQDVGVDGTIDPYVWIDGAEKTMFVGNFKGIFAVPLNTAGDAPAGPPIQVADKRFEAAYVQQRDGYYYLYVSAGNCCLGASTAYRVLVGRSAALTGPYLDRKGDDLNAGGGALILAGDDRYAGPGHNAIVTDDAGEDWIVYHATPRRNLYLPNGVQRREGMLDRVVWKNGWPEVGDGSPSSTWPQQPVINLPARARLVGSASGLPAAGGTITGTFTVAAPPGSGFTGQVWAEVVSPGGARTPVPLDTSNVTLAPGESRDIPIVVNIPGGASAGVYEVLGHVGASPSAPSDFGALRVEKARGNLDPPPAPGPGASSLSSLSGSLSGLGG